MNPTAQTSVDETAATLKSSLSTEAGLGLVTTLHCVPFQCSISVWEGPPLACHPTAQISLAETTATLVSVLYSEPVLGLCTTLYCVPSHCSITVWPLPLWLPEVPTAQISLAETAATPLRPLLLSPLGLGTTLHFPQELGLKRFWKPCPLDGAAFASLVVSDRALSRTVTIHNSIATLIKRFIMCPP